MRCQFRRACLEGLAETDGPEELATGKLTSDAQTGNLKEVTSGLTPSLRLPALLA